MKAKHLLSMTFALVAFAGCAKEQLFEQDSVQGDLIPISVNSSIRQEPTKATADGFVGGDAIGLFAVNYTENNTQAGTLVAEGNQADNVKYVFDEPNHKWAPVKPVYYKDINTHADLYLYYPYQASISDVNAAGFEVQKDQSSTATETSLSGYEASDFLWGKGEDITPSQSAVNIRLSHKMAAVKVTLAEGEGFEDGEFESLEKSIILTNTTRKATINYATGEVAPLGAPQMDGIVMCPQFDGSWRAIAVPQSVAAGTQLFAITVNGMSYSLKQGEATEYQSGKQTEFTITVKKKSPAGELEFTLTDAQITDWTEDLNTHGGEARQYFVVNVAEPGTLQATIESMGKNPAKIKNLKVVGIVNADDFGFMNHGMTILEAINMKESTCVDNTIPAFAFNGKTSLTYFVFPEHISEIGPYAFDNTTLSGALIIPNDVVSIDYYAFNSTQITSVVFNDQLRTIDHHAFYRCQSLTGSLHFPSELSTIGENAFGECNNLSGGLHLPESLEMIGKQAFYNAGDFSSGLSIPEKITHLYEETFAGTRFHGKLELNNCIEIDRRCFYSCGFSGELIIPTGVTTIPYMCFYGGGFTKIVLPESLKKIEEWSLGNMGRLEKVEFNEGLVSIGPYAFNSDRNLLSLHFPSTLQSIQNQSFTGCYYISSISCDAVEPPSVKDAFISIAKDNFAVEVPEQSIVRYQTDMGWGDFKRIIAHYDFSIGRARMRAMNARMQRTYTLRCPAGNRWEVTDTPEWINVSPTSGIGKTDVTITVSEMQRTEDMFEVNLGSFQYPNYQNYKGRKDTVVFSLSGKEYTCQIEVEQYDYDRYDGEVITHQLKNVGKGIDIVFIGEGYDAKDIVDGKFETDCQNGYNHFFSIEPYKTYRDHFNVFSVVSQSDESGIETANTILDNKFMKSNGILDVNAAFQWAKMADLNMNLSKTVVILLENCKNYYGSTYLYADGSALSIVPISEDAYPYDFRGIIQHEAGGHAFGKLGEEYIMHPGYISTCGCDCCEHPVDEISGQYGLYKSLGWYKNLSMYSDHNMVPWAHLMFHPKYSNRVDMYEGAYMHMRGMYRSEITSCMNNNIPYFNAISRQAIVERIKEYAGETFDFDEFVARDNFDVGTKASMQNFDWTFGVDPKWNRGTEKGSIIYMGEHPDVK